ncbi:MAG TPA: 50S ribosomal protein L28, partial [Spirochaetaceae bacterium]|nr:50S ribosomal protein L28 [Spirochaetaceae bacterium]
CGKGTMYGNNVSHAKNHSRRTWLPNLISMRTKIDGTVLKVKICAKCLKSGKIVKHV